MFKYVAAKTRWHHYYDSVFDAGDPQYGCRSLCAPVPVGTVPVSDQEAGYVLKQKNNEIGFPSLVIF